MTINAITTRSRVNGKDTTSGKQCIPRLESIRRKERWADPDPKEKRPAVTTTTSSAGMRSRKPGPHLCFFLSATLLDPASHLGTRHRSFRRATRNHAGRVRKIRACLSVYAGRNIFALHDRPRRISLRRVSPSRRTGFLPPPFPSERHTICMGLLRPRDITPHYCSTLPVHERKHIPRALARPIGRIPPHPLGSCRKAKGKNTDRKHDGVQGRGEDGKKIFPTPLQPNTGAPRDCFCGLRVCVGLSSVGKCRRRTTCLQDD